MMEEEKYKNTKYIGSYVCDCGSLLVMDVNNTFGVLIPNGLGDCRADIYESTGTNSTSNWHFITTVYGSFNIHSYDCLDENGDMYDGARIVKMVNAKRTAFYNDGEGNILYEIWE